MILQFGRNMTNINLILISIILVLIVLIIIAYFRIKKIFIYNHLFNEIYEKTPGVISIKSYNKGFKYIYVNQAFCDLIKLTKHQIIGKTDFDLYDNELAKKYRELDKKTTSEPKGSFFSEEALFGEGEYWNTIRTHYKASNGEIFIITISSDISNIHNAYLQLEKAKRKAEESDKLKSMFLANMNHEIRTPLNAILGFSELIQESTNFNETLKYKEIININSTYLIRVIDQIMDLSKLESKNVKFENFWFDLDEIIEKISSNFTSNENVSFNIRYPAYKYMIYSDKELIYKLRSEVRRVGKEC